MAAKLKLENVYKNFGTLQVCKGVNFEVNESELICLIGASGSGKSTILRCINLLEPIDDGRILLDGIDISEPALDPNADSSKNWHCVSKFQFVSSHDGS